MDDVSVVGLRDGAAIPLPVPLWLRSCRVLACLASRWTVGGCVRSSIADPNHTPCCITLTIDYDLIVCSLARVSLSQTQRNGLLERHGGGTEEDGRGDLRVAGGSSFEVCTDHPHPPPLGLARLAALAWPTFSARPTGPNLGARREGARQIPTHSPLHSHSDTPGRSTQKGVVALRASFRPTTTPEPCFSDARSSSSPLTHKTHRTPPCPFFVASWQILAICLTAIATEDL